MNKYYTPSGNFSYRFLLFLLLFSCILFPFLAFFYSFLIWNSFFVYINFVFTFLFGISIGLVAALGVIEPGKVRNKRIAICIGTISAFISLYIHWAIWGDYVIIESLKTNTTTLNDTQSSRVFELLRNPSKLLYIISEVNSVGTWHLLGSQITHFPLILVWLLETVIIFGTSIFFCTISAQNPYCEIDDKWIKEHELPSFNFIQHKFRLVSAIEKGDEDIFAHLEKQLNHKDDYSIFTLFDNDYGDIYLSITNHKASITDNSFTADDFVQFIAISDRMRDVLWEKAYGKKIVSGIDNKST